MNREQVDTDGHGFRLPQKNTKTAKHWSADFQIGTVATGVPAPCLAVVRGIGGRVEHTGKTRSVRLVPLATCLPRRSKAKAGHSPLVTLLRFCIFSMP